MGEVKILLMMEKKAHGQSQSEGENNNISNTQIKPNSVLSSKEDDIDWDAIKNDIENINETWSIVVLDLSSLNIDNSDILNFSAVLNDCILSIKDENKLSTLVNIAKLYSFIPVLERDISGENNLQNIKKVKSYIINAYSLVEQNDWIGVETNIGDAEDIYKNLINDMEFIKNKEYKVNKTYVLLKELQNSLTYRDKKLFYVKYKNLMESINTL